MNKFSLISMALSVLFCGYLNAEEQPVSTDTPADAASDVATSEPTATEPAAEEKTENVVKKTKVSKNKKGKKCKSKHSLGNEFTEKLNKGENLDVKPATGSEEPKAN